VHPAVMPWPHVFTRMLFCTSDLGTGEGPGREAGKCFSGKTGKHGLTAGRGQQGWRHKGNEPRAAGQN
jgi:hypothetical protein